MNLEPEPEAGASASPPPPAPPASESSDASIPPLLKDYSSKQPFVDPTVQSVPPLLPHFTPAKVIIETNHALASPFPNPQPRIQSSLVRWIMVVTLGCSLGLLLVLVAVSLRQFSRNPEVLDFMRSRQDSLSQFRFSNRQRGDELQRVIDSQLSAFRSNDYPAAYEFATSGFKSQIPLSSFERLVKTSYPFLIHSRSAQYGLSIDNGNQALINVIIFNNKGRARHYQYILDREGDSWRIHGVKEVVSEGSTA